MSLKKLMFSLMASVILIIGLVACGSSEPVPDTDEPGEEPAVQETQVESSSEEETGDVESTGMKTFAIVPEQSQASYLVDEEFLDDALGKLGIEAGKKDVVGSTRAIEGQLQMNPTDMSQVLGENSFTVDMRTLKSDQERRDNYILDKGPSFNSFPVATFNATEIIGLPENYVEGNEVQFQMSGTLTVHDVAVPITFDVIATLDGDTLTGIAETRSLMSDFGIEPPDFARTLTVADEFGIRVEFVAKET